MSLKNNVIKRRDFERYEIIVPFSSLVGRRRKSFLSSELEKRHPCFSDEFAFDSKVKGLSRKGVCSDVLVMNKIMLAEYERKRHRPGFGFLIESESGKAKLFSHPYFVESKYKLSLASFLGIIIVCFTGLLSGRLFRSVYNRVSISSSSQIEESESSVISESQDYIRNAPEYFFKSVLEAGGKLLDFEYKTEGLAQRFSASVKSVFPESLEAFLDHEHRESVIYEEGLPLMKVTYSWRTAPAADVDEGRGMMANSDFNKALRDAVFENGAVLKEETAPPYHIAFSCKKESKQLFQDLSKMIADDGRTVTSLNVHSADNNELQVGITIECLPIEGFDLSLISECLALFTNSSSKEMNKQDVPAALMKTNDVKVSNPINVIQDKVVGVIKRPDNSSIVFYKDSDGKLKTLIKQKEE